jgi:hypothetical protein
MAASNTIIWSRPRTPYIRRRLPRRRADAPSSPWERLRLTSLAWRKRRGSRENRPCLADTYHVAPAGSLVPRHAHSQHTRRPWWRAHAFNRTTRHAVARPHRHDANSPSATPSPAPCSPRPMPRSAAARGPPPARRGARCRGLVPYCEQARRVAAPTFESPLSLRRGFAVPHAGPRHALQPRQHPTIQSTSCHPPLTTIHGVPAAPTPSTASVSTAVTRPPRSASCTNARGVGPSSSRIIP